MEMFCRDQVGAVGRELSEQQVVVKHAVAAVQDHLSQDQSLLDQQRNEVLLQMQLNQQLVHNFLLEELQQDVPTGMKVVWFLTSGLLAFGHLALSMPSGTTPQRRELVYPRELMKLQSRCELLETLRKQQEVLQAALQEEEGEQEDEDMQDSLEDELSTCNESVATEPSFDENLVFNESKRLPFFKVSDKNKIC